MWHNHLPKIFWLFLLTLVFSCHDNEEVTQVEDVTDPPKIVISTSHFCTIKDENGSDLDMISAAFGGKTWQASVDGNLLVEGKQISKYYEPLEVNNQDGFSSKVFLSGTENDVNYQTLGVFTQYQYYTFTTDQTKSYALDDNINLEFNANSYMLGPANYTGSVLSQVVIPDMFNSNHINALPHVRIGKKTTGSIGYLNVAVSFYVAIQGNNHQNLSSTMKIVGNHTLEDNGPSKLWFFDQNKAVWVEHPMKVKGDNVEFKYENSGFYCIGEWQPGAYFTGQVHVGDLPLAHLQLKFVNIENQFDIYTSNKGNWTTYLPLNTEVNAQIHTSCGIVKELQINTINGTRFIDSDIADSTSDFVFIDGIVKDCDGKDATNFVLQETQSGNTFFVKGHTFQIYLPSCGQEKFSITVSNQLGDEKGPKLDWKNDNVINTGTWLACDMANEPYFNLIIDGKNKIYWNTKSSLHQDGRMILQALDEQMSPVLSMILPTDGVGMKHDEMCNILLQEPSFLGKQIEVFCPTSTLGCGFEEIFITHFGDGADGYIRGYFKGRFWAKTFEPLSANYSEINGEFHIKKEF